MKFCESIYITGRGVGEAFGTDAVGETRLTVASTPGGQRVATSALVSGVLAQGPAAFWSLVATVIDARWRASSNDPSVRFAAHLGQSSLLASIRLSDLMALRTTVAIGPRGSNDEDYNGWLNPDQRNRRLEHSVTKRAEQAILDPRLYAGMDPASAAALRHQQVEKFIQENEGALYAHLRSVARQVAYNRLKDFDNLSPETNKEEFESAQEQLADRLIAAWAGKLENRGNRNRAQVGYDGKNFWQRVFNQWQPGATIGATHPQTKEPIQIPKTIFDHAKGLMNLKPRNDNSYLSLAHPVLASLPHLYKAIPKYRPDGSHHYTSYYYRPDRTGSGGSMADEDPLTNDVENVSGDEMGPGLAPATTQSAEEQVLGINKMPEDCQTLDELREVRARFLESMEAREGQLSPDQIRKVDDYFSTFADAIKERERSNQVKGIVGGSGEEAANYAPLERAQISHPDFLRILENTRKKSNPTNREAVELEHAMAARAQAAPRRAALIPHLLRSMAWEGLSPAKAVDGTRLDQAYNLRFLKMHPILMNKGSALINTREEAETPQTADGVWTRALLEAYMANTEDYHYLRRKYVAGLEKSNPARQTVASALPQEIVLCGSRYVQNAYEKEVLAAPPEAHAQIKAKWDAVYQSLLSRAAQQESLITGVPAVQAVDSLVHGLIEQEAKSNPRIVPQAEAVWRQRFAPVQQALAQSPDPRDSGNGITPEIAAEMDKDKRNFPVNYRYRSERMDAAIRGGSYEEARAALFPDTPWEQLKNQQIAAVAQHAYETHFEDTGRPVEIRTMGQVHGHALSPHIPKDRMLRLFAHEAQEIRKQIRADRASRGRGIQRGPYAPADAPRSDVDTVSPDAMNDPEAQDIDWIDQYAPYYDRFHRDISPAYRSKTQGGAGISPVGEPWMYMQEAKRPHQWYPREDAKKSDESKVFTLQPDTREYWEQTHGPSAAPLEPAQPWADARRTPEVAPSPSLEPLHQPALEPALAGVPSSRKFTRVASAASVTSTDTATRKDASLSETHRVAVWRWRI